MRKMILRYKNLSSLAYLPPRNVTNRICTPEGTSSVNLLTLFSSHPICPLSIVLCPLFSLFELPLDCTSLSPARSSISSFPIRACQLVLLSTATGLFPFRRSRNLRTFLPGPLDLRFSIARARAQETTEAEQYIIVCVSTQAAGYLQETLQQYIQHSFRPILTSLFQAP